MPIETAQLTGQLGGIARPDLRLGLRSQDATLKRCQHFQHPLCPSLCKACPQTQGIVFRGDGTLLAPQHGPSVEVLVHLHDGVACHRFAMDEGPVHRGSPAVFGEQRGMEIDTTVWGQREHSRREQIAIRHDHNNI
jgi:hypothetical protein